MPVWCLVSHWPSGGSGGWVNGRGRDIARVACCIHQGSANERVHMD